MGVCISFLVPHSSLLSTACSKWTLMPGLYTRNQRVQNVYSDSAVTEYFFASFSTSSPFFLCLKLRTTYFLYRRTPSSEMALQHQRRDDLSDEGFVFKLYQYDPSLPAAIVTVAAFAILTAIHVWRLYVFRSFYFTAFTIGGVCKWKYQAFPIQGHRPSTWHVINRCLLLRRSPSLRL